MQVKSNQPATIYIKFAGGLLPKKFEVRNSRGELYYFRYLDGKTPRIKFNVCHADTYFSHTPFEVVKIVDIEIPTDLPTLPDFSRDRIKDFTIVYNPNLIGTPARVFTKDGIVEKGRDLYKYPKPLRVFILLHEVGHFFYGLTDEDITRARRMKQADGEKFVKDKKQQGEENCDTFALINYLKMGYNRSMAYYALSKVLARSPGNIGRLKALFYNIQKTQSNALT